MQYLMKKSKKGLFYFLGLIFLTSCLKDKTIKPINPECVGLTVSYNDNIKPLVAQSCATNQGPGTGCHDDWIFEYSNLYEVINSGMFEHKVFETGSMPQIPNSFNIDPLTEEEINTLKCWIADGYPDN